MSLATTPPPQPQDRGDHHSRDHNHRHRHRDDSRPAKHRSVLSRSGCTSRAHLCDVVGPCASAAAVESPGVAVVVSLTSGVPVVLIIALGVENTVAPEMGVQAVPVEGVKG